MLQHPDDLDAERKLLQIYTVAPGRSDPARQALRLQRILYLVQHHPESALSGSSLTYVYRAGNSPRANATDHEAVRSEWLNAVQSHPRNTAVTLNAVWFLAREDAEDAEQVLVSAIEGEPAKRKLAANLGFLYATELLGQEPLSRDRAMAALKESANPIVLAAAGTALPNLSRANNVDAINQTMFDLASELSTQARELAPDDPDIQGPMPFIDYFAAAQDAARAAAFPQQPPAPAAPSGIRIAENVQAENPIRKTDPKYPERARAAGITGDVRMNVVIGRDGTVQTVQLISGHLSWWMPPWSAWSHGATSRCF